MRNNASRSTALLLLRQANKTLLALLLLLLLLGCNSLLVSGFLNHQQQPRNNDRNNKKSSAEKTTNNNAPPSPASPSSTARFMIHNGFGSFGNFLNSNSNKNRTESSSSYNMAAAAGGGGGDDEEDEAAGTFRLLEIPVQDIKPGGLRLFLMFYLMGMQNTPDPNTWKADQPSTEEYIIDFWYQKDAPNKRTILSVELSKTSGITFDRVGSSPTTQYLMQEAVIVQGLLDELELCAKDENVAVKDRLLILQEPDAISQAREALAFG